MTKSAWKLRDNIMQFVNAPFAPNWKRKTAWTPAEIAERLEDRYKDKKAYRTASMELIVQLLSQLQGEPGYYWGEGFWNRWNEE